MSTALSIADLATRWKLGESTIRRLAADREIPRPMRIGGQYRFTLASIERFEQAGMHQVAREEFRQFVNDFGPTGGVAFAEGLSYEEAEAEFAKKHRDELDELQRKYRCTRERAGEILVKRRNKEFGFDGPTSDDVLDRAARLIRQSR
jgi:predicted DNA-binding transcriptional regulator AlpA